MKPSRTSILLQITPHIGRLRGSIGNAELWQLYFAMLDKLDISVYKLKIDGAAYIVKGESSCLSSIKVSFYGPSIIMMEEELR